MKGPRTKYDPEFHIPIIKWMARNGLTDEQMSNELGIHRSTLSEWKKKYIEIADTLKTNKNYSDESVVKSLYQRALGYEAKETEIIHYKDGTQATKIRIKHIAADVLAIIYWLKNRRPQEFNDRKELEPGGVNIGRRSFEEVIKEARGNRGIETDLPNEKQQIEMTLNQAGSFEIDSAKTVKDEDKKKPFLKTVKTDGKTSK